MTIPESTLPFDVLSYPRASRTDGYVFDVATPFDIMQRRMVNLGRGALIGATDREVVDHYVVGARWLGCSPSQVMAVTDRSSAAEIALSTGMGVTVVDGLAGMARSLEVLQRPQSQSDHPLYEYPLYTDLSYEEVAKALFKPGEVNVVGFVGRTGAGKSTTIRRLVEATQAIGGHAGLFEVDAFFIRSRQERKAWLNEPGISDAERADRQRVITWWDLGRAADTLASISAGEHIKIDGLYDMRQGGEMVGTLDIDPGEAGYTVFVEGTALLVPEFDGTIDSFVYMNTHDQVRAKLLMQRNTQDGYTPEESRTRKLLTDAAETDEHLALSLRQRRASVGNVAVLDNTQRSTRLRLMPPYIPRK